MGLVVNGTVITRTQSFPITGSFDVYQWKAFANSNRASLQATLDAMRKVD